MDVTVVSTRADALKDVLQGPLAARLPDGVQLRFFPDTDSVDERGLLAPVALGAPDALAALLPRMPRLEWLQSTWAGVTPLIGLPRRDYLLTGVKDIFGASMSEYALGWVLAFRRSILHHAQQRRWSPEFDQGLAGMRIGIAGVGSIGQAVAQQFERFGAKLRGLNSDGRPVPGCAQCFATGERCAFADGLEALLMILPDTPATNQLIDAEVFARLHPGAIVINAGRANSLHLPDALAALKNARIRALVLDVFESEPLADADPLWETEGVYITSHTAAPTDMHSIAALFVDNLQRYRAGETLQGLIDFDRGY